jgi:hypothetical protein
MANSQRLRVARKTPVPIKAGRDMARLLSVNVTVTRIASFNFLLTPKGAAP